MSMNLSHKQAHRTVEGVCVCRYHHEQRSSRIITPKVPTWKTEDADEDENDPEEGRRLFLNIARRVSAHYTSQP